MVQVNDLIKTSINLAIYHKSLYVTPIHLARTLLEFPEICNQLTLSGLQDKEILVKEFNRVFLSNLDVSNHRNKPIFSYQFELVMKSILTDSLLSDKISLTNLDIFVNLVKNDKEVSNILCNVGVDVKSITEKADLPSPITQKTKHDKLETVFSPIKNLEKFTKNYISLAATFKFPPFFGREKEIQQICHSLIRKTKNSVLLIGEPGVGKSAMIAGLAQIIVNDNSIIPEQLHKTQIFQLDINDLIAGTKHHGTFEERIKNIFDEIRNIPDAVLFIDEIHNIMNFSGGNLDLAAIIKDAISNDNLRVIGTVSIEDYRKYLDKDRNFLRRFNKINIEESSEEETIQILNGIKSSLEQFYDYNISDDAIVASVILAKKYMGNKHFPDKAIDLLDSALSSAKMKQEKKNYIISKNDILKEVSNFTKISETVLNESEKTKLSSLRDRLEKNIFGQSEAISKIVDCILISKTGLRAETKTVANLLFMGMSGVGKTELAKELAKNLGVDLLRFDLSAYQEKFSLSVLIGSPPGYLGYSDGRAGDGLLVNAIEKSPNGVILLDEVEKAHPEVLNIMLQMMDYGILTSAGGKSVSCRNNIIIMTSNIGSEHEIKQRIGFGNTNNSDKIEESLSSFFKPEFRARLDAIINFNKLSEKQIESVVIKVFNETILLIKKSGIKVEITQDIIKYITLKTFSSNFGARNVGTVIDSEIKPKIAEVILGLEDNIDTNLIIDYIDDQVIVKHQNNN